MKVCASKPLKRSLLILIDGELGRESVALAAGLDLDEAKRGTIPGDEVDVATKFRSLPTASDDGVSRASEKKECLAFAQSTDFKVLCRVGTVQGMKSADGPRLYVDPEPRQSAVLGSGGGGESHATKNSSSRRGLQQRCFVLMFWPTEGNIPYLRDRLI
jgi:hypothetical protein